MMTPETLNVPDELDDFSSGYFSTTPSTTVTPAMLARNNTDDSQYSMGGSTPEILQGDSEVALEGYGDFSSYVTGTRALKRQSLELLQTHSMALHSAMGTESLAEVAHDTRSPALRDWSPDARPSFNEGRATPTNGYDYPSTTSGLPSTPPMQQRARTLADAAFTDDVNRFIDFDRYGLVAPNVSPTRKPSRRVFTLPEDEIVDLINK
jgi:hypothetical protein